MDKEDLKYIKSGELIYNGEEKIFESILLNEGKQDKENFKKWLYNVWKQIEPNLNDEMLNANVNTYYDWFEQNKANLKSPQNDYYYWIKQQDPMVAFNELDELVDTRENVKQQKQKEKDGAKLLYDKDGWKVYEITNYEASKKYGANTKWCISGSKRWANGENGEGHWNAYYQEHNVRFFFFINGDTKYALALYPDNTNYEIFDEQDNEIQYIPNAPKIDEIPVDYTTVDDERTLKTLIATNKLPYLFTILERVVDYDCQIFEKDSFDYFLSEVRDYIDPGYVMWLAVQNDRETPEWFEKQTGDEYIDEWMGDYGWFDPNEIGDIVYGYSTLDDALTKDNPHFRYDNSEFFYIFRNDWSTSASGAVDFLDLMKSYINWFDIDDLDDLADKVLVVITNGIDNGDFDIEEFTKLGLSEDYLRMGEIKESKLKRIHLNQLNEVMSKDELSNRFKEWQTGWSSFDDVFDNEANEYMNNNLSTTNEPLYRVQLCKYSFLPTEYSIGDIIKFDRKRSFSKSEKGFNGVLSDISVAHSPDEYVCFKTNGEIKYFDATELDMDSHYDYQEEIFIEGTFKVVAIEKYFNEFENVEIPLYIIEQQSLNEALKFHIVGYEPKEKKINKSDLSIQKFYDRHLRLWTLYLIDKEGNQVGNTQYTNDKNELKEFIKDMMENPKEYLYDPEDLVESLKEPAKPVIQNFLNSTDRINKMCYELLDREIIEPLSDNTICYLGALYNVYYLTKNGIDCKLHLGTIRLNPKDTGAVNMITHAWVEDKDGNIYQTNNNSNYLVDTISPIEFKAFTNLEDVKNTFIEIFTQYR